MSQIELVLIPFGIIVGFGITQILEDWARQLRPRSKVEPNGLQVGRSLLVLFGSVIYPWTMWVLRDIQWTLPLYLFAALPGLALALAARISMVDDAPDAPPVLEQYFESSGLVYGLLCVLPLSAVAMTWIFDAGPVEGPSGSASVVGIGLRVLLVAVLVGLVRSKSVRFHRWAQVVIGLALFAVAIRVFFVLA